MDIHNIYNDDVYILAALWVCRGDAGDEADVTTSHPQRASGYDNRCNVWDGTYQSAISQLASYRTNGYT